jgi:hypothetical protein
MTRWFLKQTISVALAIGSFATTGIPCTRALYVGHDGTVITGRSMDCAEDMGTNLWAFPEGIARDGIGSIIMSAIYAHQQIPTPDPAAAGIGLVVANVFLLLMEEKPLRSTQRPDQI